MEAAHRDREPEQHHNAAGTLGGVLYGKSATGLVSEEQWAALVRAVAAGDQLALHALYERSHRPVFTLIVRITGNRETAEEVTLDVFHDVWRRAAGYNPEDGTVLGWVMNQARSRAIDRVRFDTRKKRVGPNGNESLEVAEALDTQDALQLKQQGAALQRALQALNRDERQAIEMAFYSELTYAEVAVRLNQPLGTIKTRIRSGMQKLRQALGSEARQ